MSNRRTILQIWKELTAHPFFPLLFYGKAAELTGFAAIGHATWEEAILMWILAIGATVIWSLSDSVNVEFEGNVIK